jgi:murein DD-endopeptidase MepM/ murein hydrolase activator NlpD
MSTPRPQITFMVHRDGEVGSRSLRMPVWLFRVLALLGTAGLMGALILGALYAPLLKAAASVPRLREDVARLEAETAKVRELAAALDSAERRYGRLREMVGADIVPDPIALAYSLPLAPPVSAAPPGGRPTPATGPTLPNRWPLEAAGYITRGMVAAGGSEEEHTGLDIAVTIGTPVRAVGGGTVLDVGSDSEYGQFVLIAHPDGYQTKYGHLSRTLVSPGSLVGTGEVIALSGNSGRSTAPHLHLEIRRGDATIDPLTMVNEDSR